MTMSNDIAQLRESTNFTILARVLTESSDNRACSVLGWLFWLLKIGKERLRNIAVRFV